MPIGLILTIITTLIIILIFVFNHKTKKVFGSYWFYLITSIGFLIYFIFSRWLVDLKSWINHDDKNYLGGIDVVKSKVLLLDMCPFGFVVLSTCLIFDYKRYFASAISYFGIVGGAVTIFGQIMFEGVGTGYSSWLTLKNMSWAQYTFENQMYFMMHFYLLIMSIIVLLNSKSFNLSKIIVSHIYAITFFVYISIMVFTLDIKWNATGIVENDWSSFGEYSVLGSMLNLVWPWDPIVVFLFVWLLIVLLIFVRNIMVLDKNYIDPKMIYPRVIRNSFMRFSYLFRPNYRRRNKY